MSEYDVWAIRERAYLARIANLETGLRNILGVADQFDADADFRSIAAIAHYLLVRNPIGGVEE